MIAKWWLLLAIVVGLFFVAGWCTTQVPKIVFPPSEDPYFSVNIQGSENSSVSFMHELAGKVERILGEYPELKHVTVANGGNFPRVKIGLLQVDRARTDAAVFIDGGNAFDIDADKILFCILTG